MAEEEEEAGDESTSKGSQSKVSQLANLLMRKNLRSYSPFVV